MSGLPWKTTGDKFMTLGACVITAYISYLVSKDYRARFARYRLLDEPRASYDDSTNVVIKDTKFMTHDLAKRINKKYGSPVYVYDEKSLI